MANIVQNRLMIEGPNTDVIERMINTLVTSGMTYWRPMPTWLVDDWAESRPTSPDPLWKVWAFEHWGCKWDIQYPELIEIGDIPNSVCYGIVHYETANSSNEEFLAWWKTVFPEYDFTLEYIDIDDDPDHQYRFTTKR